jgi:hypothetical protein
MAAMLKVSEPPGELVGSAKVRVFGSKRMPSAVAGVAALATGRRVAGAEVNPEHSAA